MDCLCLFVIYIYLSDRCQNSWTIKICEVCNGVCPDLTLFNCFFGSLPGNFVQGYKTVFNFITSMIEAVKGDIILRVCTRSSSFTNYQELSVQVLRQLGHWVQEYVRGGAVILITIFSIPSGQSVSLDSAYHSLNRTILFQLSRPLARLTGEKVNNYRHKQLLEIFTCLCENDWQMDTRVPVVREHSCEPVRFFDEQTILW